MSFVLEQNFKKASKFLNYGDHESAKQIYQDILKKYPLNLKASKCLEQLSTNSSKTLNSNVNTSSLVKNVYQIYLNKNYEVALNKAFEIYRDDKNNAELNHLIGLIELKLDNIEESIKYFKKAIDLVPNKFSFIYNYALALKKLKKINESLKYFKKALDFDINHPNVNFNLAHLYEIMGNIDLSISHYQKSLEKDKSLFESYINLALIFVSINQIENAKKIYKEGIFNNPDNFSLRNNFGKLLNSEKNYKESIIHLKKAFDINPNSAKLNFNLAMAFKGLNEFEQAVYHYRKSLDLKPDYFQAYSHLSALYYDKNLYFEAVDYIKKAIEINPEYAEAHNNFGVILRDLNLMHKSEASLIKAVNLKPNYYSAIWNLSITRLNQENYREGWLGFNSRWLNPNLNQIQSIFTNKPIWNGKDVGNLLIWSEQGIGDQIMFSRFFNNLRDYNGQIYSILNPKLENIFSESFPNINFVQSLDQDKFDFHLPVASLGEIFIKNKNDLIDNSKPYLFSKSCKIKNLSKKNKLIGISWKSVNNKLGKNKSMKLSDLINILNIPNATFVNLQYGDVDNEIQAINNQIKNKVLNLKDINMFNDIESMASLISKLDLVLTISNSTAHLAGALGKETILMLSKGRGHLWYWMHGDDKRSKWYPTIEVIQQEKINLWNNVLDEAKELIERKVYS